MDEKFESMLNEAFDYLSNKLVVESQQAETYGDAMDDLYREQKKVVNELKTADERSLLLAREYQLAYEDAIQVVRKLMRDVKIGVDD